MKMREYADKDKSGSAPAVACTIIACTRMTRQKAPRCNPLLLLHNHHLHFTILYTMKYSITCIRMTRQKAPRCNHDHPTGSPWHIFQLQSSFFHIHCSNPYNPCTIMTMMIMTMMMTSLTRSSGRVALTSIPVAIFFLSLFHIHCSNPSQVTQPTWQSKKVIFFSAASAGKFLLAR